jgi:hypothetical protein
VEEAEGGAPTPETGSGGIAATSGRLPAGVEGGWKWPEVDRKPTGETRKLTIRKPKVRALGDSCADDMPRVAGSRQVPEFRPLLILFRVGKLLYGRGSGRGSGPGMAFGPGWLRGGDGFRVGCRSGGAGEGLSRGRGEGAAWGPGDGRGRPVGWVRRPIGLPGGLPADAGSGRLSPAALPTPAARSDPCGRPPTGARRDPGRSART